MVTPLGPNGAQSRLQHWLQPLHTMPSTPPQKLGPVGGVRHTPTAAPLALTHSAVQHSSLREQMSPG
jgi:hypothetical protein